MVYKERLRDVIGNFQNFKGHSKEINNEKQNILNAEWTEMKFTAHSMNYKVHNSSLILLVLLKTNYQLISGRI